MYTHVIFVNAQLASMCGLVYLLSLHLLALDIDWYFQDQTLVRCIHSIRRNVMYKAYKNNEAKLSNEKTNASNRTATRSKMNCNQGQSKILFPIEFIFILNFM